MFIVRVNVVRINQLKPTLTTAALLVRDEYFYDVSLASTGHATLELGKCDQGYLHSKKKWVTTNGKTFVVLQSIMVATR